MQAAPSSMDRFQPSDTDGAPPVKSGRAPVNGIQMYYEVHGRHDGIPLVLLHGGGSTIDSNFGRVLPFLARTRRVIAVEEQGHGRTSDRDAPFTFERLPDARLLVLPSGHGDYFAEAPTDTDYAEITARLVDRFLAAPCALRR